jgi:proteasome lid subunit RPN8/RPN11
MLIVPANVQRAIQAHGEAAYPNEGAGLLLGQAAEGSKTVVDILPVGNEWEAGEQYHRYLITPQDVLRGESEAARRGLDVVGIFHSHPDCDAYFSKTDLENSCPWYSFLVLSVKGGKFDHANSFLPNAEQTAAEKEELIWPKS